MTISASSIIRRAVDIIVDTTSVRWPVNELARWLNDAQREIVIARPDATNTTAVVTLAAGTRQSLDTLGLAKAPAKLIEITRNVAATSQKSSVRLVPRHLLDSQTPGWHAMPGTVNILHYTFDARDPKIFYVYPPALPTAQLEVMYSAFPTNILEPAADALFSNVVGDLSVPDIYGNAVLDYILYRAYNKDSEYAGNEARAQSHYAAFANSIGVEIKATLAVQPQMKPGMASASNQG